MLVYRPLDRYGQFSARRWGPILDPGDPSFPLLWRRLGQGLLATATAAVFAIGASLATGTLLALLRQQLRGLRRRSFTDRARPASVALRGLSLGGNALLRLYVEFFRGLPVIITIFFVARILPDFGLDFATLWYLVIGLTLYNSVVIAEILRAGMAGLPDGQREAATALGLSSWQTLRLVLLPQSYRIMLPALISQVVVIFKDTSLGFLIGYEDLLQVAYQAINVLHNPIQLFAVVGVLYLVINYTLSRLAVYAQRRVARGRPRAVAVAMPPVSDPPARIART